MKRRIVSVAAISLVICMFLAACGSKKVREDSDFKSAAAAVSLNVLDVTNQYTDLYRKLTSCQSAKSSSGTYEILFFTFETNATARMAYDKMSTIIPSDASVKEGGNYISSTATTSETYFYFVCVDNTVLKVEVPSVYKAEATSFLKELGY